MHNRIAIFGLTGDPFTIAHRDICKQAIDTLKVDRLYVIPTIVDYHREGKERWLTDSERVECAEKMLWTLGPEYNKKIELDTYEIRLKQLCEKFACMKAEFVERRRFIHTLMDFKVRHSALDSELMLIIGSDELKEFRNWCMWDMVLDNIDALVVVSRNDDVSEFTYDIIEKMNGRVGKMQLSTSHLYNVSATAVRHYYRNDDLKEYLYDVKRLDDGELDWITVPWIVRKGQER